MLNEIFSVAVAQYLVHGVRGLVVQTGSKQSALRYCSSHTGSG